MRTAIVLLSFVVLLRVAGAAAEEKPEVLATVGEEAITLQDFAKYYPELVSWFGTGAKVEAVQTALEQMILSRLLAQEALQSGLEHQPKLQAQINELLAQAYLRSQLPTEKMAVEEAEVKSYYDQHRERFRLPTGVRIAHILVASEEEAQAIRQALQDQEAFDTLARERSLDPASAQRGGDLGSIVVTYLAPPLAEAALALEPGQVSGVIKTDFGYHLVKLIEKPPPTYQPYEQVQQQIQREIVAAKQAPLMRALQLKLWAKHHVAIHQAVLQTAVRGVKSQGEGGAETSPAAAQQHPARQDPAPQLRLLSAAYDLGAISAEPITHTFLVLNSGDAELIIHKVHTTCRCARATISPERLLPGQTGKVTVFFDPNYFKENGQVIKKIYIESNDREEPRKIVYLAAEIVRGQLNP